MISNFKINDLGTNRPEFSAETCWYELRTDGETVAAFAPIGRDASTKVFQFMEDERYNDDFRNKVLQIVAVRKVQERDEKGYLSHTLCGLKEEVIHEEHPTVLEESYWDGLLRKTKLDTNKGTAYND
jgi:hypothetical protein